MLPTSTRVSVKVSAGIPANADAVAILLAEGAKPEGTSALPEPERIAVQRLLRAEAFRGKAKEVVAELVDQPGGKARHLLLAGLGSQGKLSPQSFRESAAAILRAARKRRIANLAVLVPATDGAAAAIATGLLLAGFRYEEYRGTVTKKMVAEEASEVKAVLVGPGDLKEEVDEAVTIAECQNFARTIATRPGNDINPVTLAKLCQDVAKEVGLRVDVLDEKQMRRQNMGGLLGVGGGSANPPRLIVLEHNPGPRGRSPDSARPLLLVGKSITFDTGGISIKSADKMQHMIFDKCGGMAVLGAMCALARLEWPHRVVGILAAAENHVSSTAYRPGDILRFFNGVTSEITNTDAEGRLVLADALAYGIDRYRPRAVVDLATLTGGIVVALGHSIAGLFGNDDGLIDELKAAADKTGEKLWRMPLYDEHRENLKSEYADIVNSAGRWGSPLQGAAFLSHFVPDSVPWAHLDIAGVADTEKELPLYAKGATGWGVRTILEWVRGRAKR